MRRLTLTWPRSIRRPAISSLALLVFYFVVPVQSQASALVAVEIVVSVAALVVVAGVMRRQVRGVRAGGSLTLDPSVLVVLLVALILSFSLTFFLLEKARPAEMDGLHTRVDALYFTLSTMATVGFGDVHAAGQVARVLTIVLIVFDVAVLTALGRSFWK